MKSAPGIYAPYQPRFDWNLWFASLGPWQNYRFVVWTEERLLDNEPDVIALFAGNPFAGAPPQQVRAVIYQYWFTDLKKQKRRARPLVARRVNCSANTRLLSDTRTRWQNRYSRRSGG